MATAPRQSNIELLRILSMMAVILVHLDGASVGLPTPGAFGDITAADVWRIIVESITIIGVNCFTLISGYFGIRARISGFLKFTLMCMFYAVIIYSCKFLVCPDRCSLTGWIESWMVFTHTDLWYVPAYMLLYLLSPMLNSATDTLSYRNFTLWLGLFVAANIWAGWLWGGNFNPSGYTPVQLVMMYLVGRWLRVTLDRTSQPEDRIRRWSASGYVLSVGLTALLAVWMEPARVYAYNSPWVILSSVSAFVFFTTLKLTSAKINALARGAFAANLIHKNPIVWGGAIRPLAIGIWQQGSLLVYTAFCLIFTAAVYSFSAFADSFRQWLFRKAELLIDNKVKVKA